MKRQKTEERILELKNQLQFLAAKINKAHYAMEPAAKLKSEFYHLAKEYKRLKFRKGVIK